MKGYNPVSGNPLDPTYGLQEAYQDRIDTIENTLKTKYNMTDAEIADVKAGSYTGDVDTNLFETLTDLEDAKEKEKITLEKVLLVKENENIFTFKILFCISWIYITKG